MRIENPDLLDHFRAKTRCEWCGGRLRYAAHPHHIFCRGQGDASRMDIAYNLISLGGPWDCAHHDKAHWGKIARADLFMLVSWREKILIDDMMEELWQIRWLPTPRWAT